MYICFEAALEIIISIKTIKKRRVVGLKYLEKIIQNFIAKPQPSTQGVWSMGTLVN
jgi:hypothetical protein